MEWYTIIGLSCTAGGFAIAWITLRVRQKKENEEGGLLRGVMQSDIGYIKAGIDDLKKDNKEARNMICDLSERVVRVEESCKQAHKRIDNLDKNE